MSSLKKAIATLVLTSTPAQSNKIHIHNRRYFQAVRRVWDYQHWNFKICHDFEGYRNAHISNIRDIVSTAQPPPKSL